MNKKIKIPTKTNVKGTDWNWVIKIFFITFILALVMSTGANEALAGVNVYFAFAIQQILGIYEYQTPHHLVADLYIRQSTLCQAQVASYPQEPSKTDIRR